MPGERVRLLIDADSPLLGCPARRVGTDFPVGAGVFTGIGVVENVECVIVANDPTVRSGTSTTATVTKTLRAMEIARENRLPLDLPRRVRAAPTSPTRPRSSCRADRARA